MAESPFAARALLETLEISQVAYTVKQEALSGLVKTASGPHALEGFRMHSSRLMVIFYANDILSVLSSKYGFQLV